MTSESTGVRLGDLLTGAGLLKPADLREAMLIAKQQGLPVGRVLIMSAYLTEHQLQAAVRAQSMLKDGLIDQETVLKALTLVGAEDLSLDEALKTLHWFQQEDVVTNKLGELLLEAEVVTKEQLQSSLAQCETIGLPLGRVLVVTSIITEPMLAAALNAQVLVRDKKITREQALTGLKSSKDRQIPIEHALAEHGVTHLPTYDTIRLGELLLEAKLIDEPNLMGAVELGLINEKLIGEVLREQNLVPEETVFAALDVQKMVAEGTVKKADAPAAIALVHNKKISLSAALEELNPAPPPPAPQPEPETTSAQPTEETDQSTYAPPTNPADSLPLYQFLQLAGLITPKDIETAVRIGSKDSVIMGRMLVLSGILDQPMVSIAQKSSELIARGILNTEQGLMVIKTCKGSGISLDDAFTQFNWDKQSLKLVENVGLPLNERGEFHAPSAVPMLPTITSVKAAGARSMTQTLQIEPTTNGSTAAEWGQQYAQPGISNLAAVARVAAAPEPSPATPTDADLWGVEPADRSEEKNPGVKPLSKTLSSLWGSTGEHSQPQPHAEAAPAASEPSATQPQTTSSGQNWSATSAQTTAWGQPDPPQPPRSTGESPALGEAQSVDNPWAAPVAAPETAAAPQPEQPASAWAPPATAGGWTGTTADSSGTGTAWTQQPPAEAPKTSQSLWSASASESAAQVPPQAVPPPQIPAEQQAAWAPMAQQPAPGATPAWPDASVRPTSSAWSEPPAQQPATPAPQQWTEQPPAQPANTPSADWTKPQTSQWSEQAAPNPAATSGSDWAVGQAQTAPNWGQAPEQPGWAGQQQPTAAQQPAAAQQPQPATSGAAAWQSQSTWSAPAQENQQAAVWGTADNAQPQPQPTAAWGQPDSQPSTQPSPFQTLPPAQMAQQIAQHQGWQQSTDPTQAQPTTTEDVIDELNEEDQQEKPKKRLMDFMPKLGS